MTKPSALITAGALVVGLMAGVAARDAAQTVPGAPTQIVVQFQQGGSTGTITPSVAPAPAPQEEGGG